MIPDDLQTLIDLPSNRVMFFARDDGTETQPFLTTDKLIAIATELLERRAFDEWASDDSTYPRFDIEVNIAGDEWYIGEYDEQNTLTVTGRGKTQFKAWQNAKEAGKL